ncbi:hypothetical protein ENBRE01_2253 [Enteropsectra breve]|nr:hypothetical protein ENBRE01_2253 [Enteropsectra breve]
MIIVSDKSKEKLEAKILRNIEYYSDVVSDQWSAYMSWFNDTVLYDHNSVNHRYNFIDPNDGAHTQNIESLWSEFKRLKNRLGYSKKHLLELYISEFTLRRSFKDEKTMSTSYS